MILILIFLLFIPFVYAQNCIDPDGGLDYSKQSCVTFYGIENFYCDRCIRSNVLIETRCEGDNLILTKYDCPNSCSDGACVSTTTTTVIPQPEDPCSVGGDYCFYNGDVSGYCVNKGYYNSHPDWFKSLTGNYSCGTYYCCIACSKNDCCWGLRGYCYSFDTSSATGCYGSYEVNENEYGYKCGEMSGERCEYETSGYYLIDSQGEPPYGSLKCVASTLQTTTTISTTSTSTSTTTTITSTTTQLTTTTASTTTSSTTTTTTQLTTTTMTSTTTTTIPEFSIKIIPTSEGCDSCPSSVSCSIECNSIIRRTAGSYDDKDYFKFTLNRRMKVRIHLNSTILPGPIDPNTNEPEYYLFGDYDLYTKWDGSCPDVSGPYYGGVSYFCYEDCQECTRTDCCNQRTGKYDCGPCSDNVDEYNNMIEICPEEGERILEIGTYYFLIYNFDGSATYDINMICSDITQVTTTTTVLTTTTSITGITTTTTPSGTTTILVTSTPHFETTTTAITSGVTTTKIPHLETTTTIKGGGGGGFKTPTMTLNINNTIIMVVILALVSLLVIFGMLKFTKSKNVEPTPKYGEENSEQPFY